jgi:hypothetical protein
LSAIFRAFNVSGRGAKDLHSTFRKRARKVVRYLASNRNHNTEWILSFIDVQHPLQAQLLKVQPITFVVVCADSFWVVVDNNTLETIST